MDKALSIATEQAIAETSQSLQLQSITFNANKELRATPPAWTPA